MTLSCLPFVRILKEVAVDRMDERMKATHKVMNESSNFRMISQDDVHICKENTKEVKDQKRSPPFREERRVLNKSASS